MQNNGGDNSFNKEGKTADSSGEDDSDEDENGGNDDSKQPSFYSNMEPGSSS